MHHEEEELDHISDDEDIDFELDAPMDPAEQRAQLRQQQQQAEDEAAAAAAVAGQLAMGREEFFAKLKVFYARHNPDHPDVAKVGEHYFSMQARRPDATTPRPRDAATT